MSIQQLWTAEMLQTATKLWFEPEWTATRIAQRINDTYGTTITRNAVIGKVHRALGPVAKNIRAPGSGNLVSSMLKRPKPPSHQRRSIPHPPLHPLPPDDQIVGVTLMDLEDNCCRWICASADEPIYCGRPKDTTRVTPYCPAHAERAKAPRRPHSRVRWNVRIAQAFQPG